MGITGLLPFIEKASRRVDISEFNGCTVAVDSYCWLHKGAFACADKLVRGEDTDVHIKYCLKYVHMLLSKNIKPILVFDGRHLPAKAMTESKRRETRNISKKRAAELLKLGKIEEARSHMRRSVDITHEMALALIQECRKRNVDCIVAPYEADAQLAYLNIKNIAHLVVTEDSDLILFGCTKVLFKMDLSGCGTLVETDKLPLVMKCPIEHYTFDKFRQMCIMSGCDYLASLPGIGLAKARQFVTTTQDSNFANALKKLPGFFNRANLTVTDEYRENFLKAEATFKYQYVYDPLTRSMVRLTEPESEEIEQALCGNAGEILDPTVAFQLSLGNLDPFTLKKMDDWHPDRRNNKDINIKTESWKEHTISSHPSIWSEEFKKHLNEFCPWQKKKNNTLMPVKQKPRKKVVELVSKCVPETQDDSLSIETLSNMYCIEPSTKRPKTEPEISPKPGLTSIEISDDETEKTTIQKDKSPILRNKERSFKKILQSGSYTVLKRLSKFPRTIIDDNVVESKFFSNDESSKNIEQSSEMVKNIKQSPEMVKNPFRKSSESGIDSCTTIDNSQKENSPYNSPVKSTSPILEPSPRCNPFRKDIKVDLSQDSVIENTCQYDDVTFVSSQESVGPSMHKPSFFKRSPSQPLHSSQPKANNGLKRCRVPGLKKTTSVPSNQSLLSKFGFQKKAVLKM